MIAQDRSYGRRRASREGRRDRPDRRGRAPRGAGRRRVLRIPRPRPRVIAGLVGLLLLLGGGWMWLRDSSLVAVDRVTITGATGPDAARVRKALESAARSMTTLDVRMDQLLGAVAPYPVVRDLHVSTQFPHGMKIAVVEQNPVGAVLAAGHEIAVAGDGTLLHDLPVAGSLPQIPLRVPPGGRRLTGHDALAALAVLSAAPYQWLGRIGQVVTVAPHGLVAQLRGGPSIYFGDGARLRAKWAAASAVLADPGSAGALYVDVTNPERPAAGAGSGASSASSSGAPSSSDTAGSGSAGASGTTASASSSGAPSSSGTAGSGSAGASGATASGATSAGVPAGSSMSPGG
jgi:cell division protein FtsQ